eukprot:10839363-Alexandrium_andersonii.AAC.1
MPAKPAGDPKPATQWGLGTPAALVAQSMRFVARITGYGERAVREQVFAGVQLEPLCRRTVRTHGLEENQFAWLLSGVAAALEVRKGAREAWVAGLHHATRMHFDPRAAMLAILTDLPVLVADGAICEGTISNK